MKRKSYYNTKDMYKLLEELGNIANLSYFEEGYDDDFDGGDEDDVREYIEEYLDDFLESIEDALLEDLDKKSTKDLTYTELYEYLEEYQYDEELKYLDDLDNLSGDKLFKEFTKRIYRAAYLCIDKLFR